MNVSEIKAYLLEHDKEIKAWEKSALQEETCPICGVTSQKEIRPFQQTKGSIEFWCFDCKRVVEKELN